MTKTKSPFSKATFKFLKDLSDNNNREWFNANKGRYEDEVREPMLSFISSMQKPLAKISRHIIADPSRTGGSMFRIYRDVRFSADKTPYKIFAASQFRHETGKDAHAPGFYMHLSLNQNYVGGGIWRPDNKVLGKIRDYIVAHQDEWKKVISNKKMKDVCGTVHGESLTRPPKRFDPEHKYIDYLKLKDVVAGKEFSRKKIVGAGFQEEVIDVFKAMSPLMKFLAAALKVKW